MASLDVFKADGFSMEELTAAVNRRDFLPQRTLELGLFDPVRVRTTTISIERKAGVLTLVQTTPRGGPGETRGRNRRELITVAISRIALDDQIMADEVEGIRAFGSQSELMQIQQLVNDRAGELRRDIEFTHENHRVTALNGVMLDADGTTLLDMYSAWGLSAPAKVMFDLANATDGALRENVEANVIRVILRALKGLGSGQMRIRALCGDTFWDALIKNAEVRDSFKSQPQAEWLRQGTIFGEFHFAGVTWENYRGSDLATPTNQTVRVTADECRFVPEGIPGLFQQVFGPADYQETVNTLGMPFYTKQALDPMFQRFTALEVQSNTVSFCTVPEVLLKGDKDA